jgi:hypothetical protein
MAYFSQDEYRGIGKAMDLAESLHWFAELKKDWPKYGEAVGTLSRHRGLNPDAIARLEEVFKTTDISELTKREMK